MPISREEGIRRAEALADALAELRKTTQATERLIRQALKRYAEDDTPIAATLALTTPSDTRRSMNEALGVVESARHQMRLTIFAVGLDAGMSIGELGRAFGFSRQLAARYAKEAQPLRDS
jgi:hypothetical protein